ncbi:MAG: hypothetical protein PHY99_03930 [Bacteroidales bacterium]|jgi:hypothetical protein|nr:hypothetical protein [Bacteroidales bacterium]
MMSIHDNLKKTRIKTLIQRKPQFDRAGAANFVGLPMASKEAFPVAREMRPVLVSYELCSNVNNVEFYKD